MQEFPDLPLHAGDAIHPALRYGRSGPEWVRDLHTAVLRQQAIVDGICSTCTGQSLLSNWPLMLTLFYTNEY